ncbi:MAG: hypothetical protein ACOX6T_05650 [Myxococcales bacterium]|jgi:hypothetical protein
MGGPSRINQTPVRLNTKLTAERQTPKTDFGSRVRDGVSMTAQAVATGAAVAAPMVPGGAIISAAVSGVENMAASTSGAVRAASSGAYGVGGAPGSSGNAGGTAAIPGGSTYEQGMALLEAQQASNMRFLALQNQMQGENQQFTTLSNVMKVRHDTAKNSIQNIR